MMEILRFIFESVEHFIGMIILIVVIGYALHAIFMGIRGKQI